MVHSSYHTCARGLSGVGVKGPFAVGGGRILTWCGGVSFLETHITFIWDQNKKRDKLIFK